MSHPRGCHSPNSSDLGGLKLWGDGVSLGFLMPGDPRPRAASWGWRTEAPSGDPTVHLSARVLSRAGQLARGCMAGSRCAWPTAERMKRSIRHPGCREAAGW